MLKSETNNQQTWYDAKPIGLTLKEDEKTSMRTKRAQLNGNNTKTRSFSSEVVCVLFLYPIWFCQFILI